MLGYQVQHSPDATFEATDPFAYVLGGATSHTVSNLSANTPRHLRVRSGTGTSVNDLTYSEWSDGVSGSTADPPPATALPAPTGVSASDPERDSVTLTWNEVDGATSYEVEQRAPEGANTWVDATCGDGGDNEVEDEECVASGLTAGTDYDFRVRALSSDTVRFTTGTWSDIEETRTSGTAPATPTTPVSGGMGDLNVTWESATDSITFLWERVPDGEYETVILTTYSAAADPCKSQTTWADGDQGRSTSQKVPSLSRGNVRGLCVRTKDEDNRRVSFAWGVATPVAPAAGTPTNEDGKTTSMSWSTIDVVEDFNYSVRLVADTGRKNGMFSSATSGTDRALQKACGDGMLLDDGVADVTLTGLTETVNSGIKHFTGYSLCLRYSNDTGETDWAVSGGNNLAETYTTPATPPAPRFDQGTTSGTARTLVWTVPVRNNTDVPREHSGFEAIIIHYPVRYDHDGDGGTTALRSTPAPSVKTCGNSEDAPSNLAEGGTNPWNRDTTVTSGTSLDGVTVSGTIGIPANTAENLSVRVCVRAIRGSDGGDTARNGPWRIGGATTITKRSS